MESTQSSDRFLSRIVASHAAGLSLIATGCSAYVSFQLIPLTRAVVEDFGARAPAVSRFMFSIPWLPFATSLLATIAGVVAIVAPRKAAIVLASVGMLLGIAATLFAQYAAQLPWIELKQSIAAG